jgi:uncharacterized membrane protein YccC
MIPLSTRTKESIKTALAMVIAYAIALQLGWDKPYWAGFAVAMISLDTAGASLNKAAMRMLGTLVAGTAALTFIALFPQDRWSMMACLSLYVGICVYMFAGNRYPYFWFVSAFVAMIIIADAAPPGSLSAFRTTVTRVEETAMGILVYSLVSIFLWPQSSRGALEDASRRLAATQGELFRSYRGLMAGQGTAEASRALRLQGIELLSQCAQALAAAERDSYPVWELRRQWRCFHHQSTRLMETLERWRVGLPEIRGLELKRVLPNVGSLLSELDLRLAQIERMLGGEAPERMPEPITLAIDRTEVRALGPFQKAAVAESKSQLDRLEALSRSLFDCVADLKGVGPETSQPLPDPEQIRQRGPVFDPDRFQAAATVVTTLWAAFLIWVYIDPPKHALFVFMANQWAMGAVLARQSVSALLPGFVVGIVVGGFLYIFVMPHLSGYTQLGLMLFGVTFGVCYFTWEPHRRMVRSLTLAMFNILISVHNQQTYDFASYANTSAAILLSLALAVAIAYLPPSPRPEKVFLRLLSRFFRQTEFMLARLVPGRDQRRGLAERWSMAVYRNDLPELPVKLAAWSRRIDYRLLPGSTPKQVQELVTTLHTLAFRIEALIDAGKQPQAGLLVHELSDDVRAWRMQAQEQVGLWAKDPALASAAGIAMRDRLNARLARLEAHMEETFGRAGEGELSSKDYENFYRLLGSYRGLSETAIDYAQLAHGIDWAQWREARF